MTKLKHLFSVPLFIDKLEKKDCEIVESLIPLLIQDYRIAKHKNQHDPHWNCNSYQTYLWGHGQEKLTEAVYKYADKYLEELGFYPFTYEIESWFNIYDKGQFQEYHNHLPRLFSGMIVLQIDESHKRTEFLNQYRNAMAVPFAHYKEDGLLELPTNLGIATEKYCLPMENNSIYIWTADCLHRVPYQEKSDKLRITYTFNITPVPKK